MFKRSTKLEYIDLSNNKIKIISSVLFNSKANLKIIPLEQNECVNENFGCKNCLINQDKLTEKLSNCYAGYSRNSQLFSEGNLFFQVTSKFNFPTLILFLTASNTCSSTLSNSLVMGGAIVHGRRNCSWSEISVGSCTFRRWKIHLWRKFEQVLVQFLKFAT